MKQLWWKYLFVRFSVLFALLISMAFCLFVLADLLARAKELFDNEISWKVWGQYYACLCVYRLDVIVPFALTTAFTLFVPRLVQRNELVPLLNAGISLRTITGPFLSTAFVGAALLLFNTQVVFPRAYHRYKAIIESDFGRKAIKEAPTRLGVVFFPGGSRLFFRQHDAGQLRIDDAFWVRSQNCVFHIERLLYYKDRPPEAQGVDVIERSPTGQLHKTASYQAIELPELLLSKKTVKMATADPRELSLTQLGALISRFGRAKSEQTTETVVSFYCKLLSPLLAILAVLFPLPFCLQFDKKACQSFLVFGALATLFAFLLIVHTSIVLARIPLVPKGPVLLLPWVLAFFVSAKNIRRMP